MPQKHTQHLLVLVELLYKDHPETNFDVKIGPF
jgi:hypothetical protein